MDLKKVAFIFLASLTACKGNEPVDSSNDLEGYFEKVWTDFDQTYSYFDLKKVDWDSIYSVYRPKVVNGQTTPYELSAILGEMILTLKDLHVLFIAGDDMYYFNNRSQFETNSPDNSLNYLSAITFNTTTILYGDIENSGIAYLRIKTLNQDYDFTPLETILLELPAKDGLILDLRDNGGGSNLIARDFVNRLTVEERTFLLFRFRNGPERNDFESWNEVNIAPENPIDFNKPIVVLTNRGVVSSAEQFVAMMRVLPNSTLVGDTTRGSTGNPKEFVLSNGWRYRVSSWQAVTPAHEFIEDHGIAPDIVVFNTEESMNEGKDLMLERAVEFF